MLLSYFKKKVLPLDARNRQKQVATTTSTTKKQHNSRRQKTKTLLRRHYCGRRLLAVLYSQLSGRANHENKLVETGSSERAKRKLEEGWEGRLS